MADSFDHTLKQQLKQVLSETHFKKISDFLDEFETGKVKNKVDNDYKTIQLQSDTSNFMTTTSQLDFLPDTACANQNPCPFPFSPQNNSYAPLQMSSLGPKRGFFKFPPRGDRVQRDDLMLELNELKQSIKQVEKQPNFDLQGLINGHSSTIEALN